MTTRTEIVSAARSWLGTPYVHQASVKGEGCDCLGLLRGVWRELIGPEPEAVPPYSPDWAERAGRETLKEACERTLVPIAVDAACPGDVLLYRMRRNSPAKHCAILSRGVAADGWIVHAYAGIDVCETPSSWVAVFAFAFPGVD